VKLLTIIVNYRTAELTRQALAAAVRASAHVERSTIVVVDNDSQDGSFEALTRTARAEGYGDRVEILASDYNGGFGYGNNFAIRRALASGDPPEYVYLLNSDAFPAEDALEKLVAFMDARRDVGIAGSFVHGIDGVPHSTAFRFPTIFSEFEDAMQLGVLTKLLRRYVVPLPVPERDLEVDWVGGASMLLRTEMLEEVGLFDETFFLYFEETDLCRRAKHAGWPVVYVRDSQVAHVGSASTGLNDRSRRRPAFWFDSRHHYFVKNHGPGYLCLANAARVAGGSIFRARRTLQGQRGTRPLPDRFLRDLVGHMVRTGLRVAAPRAAAST
jgi:GT2 family glycosyltransferase